jgi:streptogramin lyase
MTYPTLVAADVVTVFQAPGPQPNGMQAIAAGLWILDQLTNEVHLVDYDGSVLHTLATASDRGSGITDDGDTLWLASTYSRELLRIDRSSGRTLASYPSPGAAVTGSHGLEWRAGRLWIATPPSATIYQLDPFNDCVVVHSFPAPGNRPHGLGWRDDELWVVETNHRAIYCYDAVAGQVRLKLSLPESAPEPHGMTVRGDELFYCDAHTRAVCRLTLPVIPPA